MKLVVAALIVAALARVHVNAQTGIIHRHLRVETLNNEVIDTDVGNDEIDASQDFWEHNNVVHSVGSCSNDANSASSSNENYPVVDDVPVAANVTIEKVESLVTSALPFDINHAKSFLLPVCLVVAALVVVAVAAVLVGVRRQQLSEPRFGPVELASDLPHPTTTPSVSKAHVDSPGRVEDGSYDEADTGAAVLGEEEEEKEEDENLS